MSHFAQVINGIVTQVIVAEQDYINTLPNPTEWIQTSYNTRGGIHYSPEIPAQTMTIPDSETLPPNLPRTFTIPASGGIPDNGVALRANFAGVGYIYDLLNDVFYAPRSKDHNGVLCESWTISAPTWTWTPPTPMPVSNTTTPTIYLWDEPTKTWITVTPT